MDVEQRGAGLRLPRSRAGSSPQHLLATVLGEYLDSADAGLPSTAVIAILAQFGISESSARAALSRLVGRGLIVARGGGRAPVYHLTAEALAGHHAHMRRFFEFGSRPPRWTGDWVMATFSIPGPAKGCRHQVRRTLTGLRMVGLYDSVWIRPGSVVQPVREALDAVLRDVAGARWSVLTARFDDEAGPHGPAAAYDLPGLAAAYRDFVERYADLRVAAGESRVDPARALVARTSLMDAWRRFPDLDPDLPGHLLPQPWPRRDARQTFLEIHTALGSLAQARLIEVATAHWPDAGRWITHFQAPPDA
ncbi:PaaX family transcriptional regulator [Actinoplanes philippinensis]|uniref:PaaX family transcriptional regulator n=1 Tax=Actinoplanes philippinensis TaxID=35752 RepID=UPI0033D01B07